MLNWYADYPEWTEYDDEDDYVDEDDELVIDEY